MAEGIVEIQGKAFSLPEGAELIVVRAPSDVQAEDLEGVELKDLVQDDASITKQIAVAYYEGEDKGYARMIPARSYFMLDKPKETKPPKVVRLERPPMVPPTGLKVSLLPYSVEKPVSKKKSKKSSKKNRKASEDDNEEHPSQSNKKRKPSEDAEAEPMTAKSKKKAKIREE